MTLPTGTLSFSQLQTEFGGSNPISLSEYYRGGSSGYVPTGTATGTSGTAVSTSGAIKLGDFRGAQRFAIQTANVEIDNLNAATGVRSSAFTLNTDGSASGASTTPAWGLPITSGIGAGYWVYATATGGGGSVYSGPLSAWTQLSSAITWAFHNGGTRIEGTSTLTINVAASSGGTTLGTYTVYFDVGYNGG